jgi:hypothetical protein
MMAVRHRTGEDHRVGGGDGAIVQREAVMRAGLENGDGPGEVERRTERRRLEDGASSELATR